MGRNPLPTAIHQLHGTPAPNAAEPRPDRLEVGTEPPSWLKDRRARQYWRDLVPVLSRARMLAMTDTTALVILAKAYGRWRQYEDYLEEHGETYETGRPGTVAIDEGAPEGDQLEDQAHGGALKRRRKISPVMLRPRPEVAMRDKAEDRLVFLLGKFGMTPSDRTKVSALPELVGDPAEEFLRGRRSA